ncbi:MULTISPECIES: endo alpha-1,4 polygalactosaminidase [Kitasatospora]|uniref:Endo alpha-1,4 polygalactosaminidase n=1 Tax=Kitasatospora cathayae TaxID=3004092 RepID=A0ABY7QH56_9ACTN|nr:endo alpha-1,4 polygalactosaminidase [Kitasatospora sp. HUAS 3-15]WBP92148.1 endo alpha-1,4 polygalactosaminidase [Kitasatospora sp. HUAS 3-15]
MPVDHGRSRRSRIGIAVALTISAAAVLAVSSCGSSGGTTEPAVTISPSTSEGTPAPATAPPAVTMPPVHAGFDYQIGGPYQPPAGVSVVSRDHGASPAPGIYNICYVNGFQAQPDAEQEWDRDLLLRDQAGNVVYDTTWNEALLDISTDTKRQRIALKVDGWIDECATKGFNAVEPDNYDSYTRSAELLSAADAEAYQSLLVAHAHGQGLAIAQKNAAELAPDRKQLGLDFAVVEQCGTYGECDRYTDAFGDGVFDIEYDEQGLQAACTTWGTRISIVRRDLDAVPPSDPGYLRQTC